MGGAASLPIRSLDQLLNRHFLTALPDAVSQIVVVVEIGLSQEPRVLGYNLSKAAMQIFNREAGPLFESNIEASAGKNYERAQYVTEFPLQKSHLNDTVFNLVQNAEQIVLRNLVSIRQYYRNRGLIKKVKGLKLQGVFGTADVLRIAREAEEKTAAKQPGERPRKLLIEEVEELEDEKEVVSDSTNSESEGSVIVVRTTQSRAN
ncbi:hypothetical protein V500_01921 [Pseudogymnoascus sp. VKM F-4518 (FW-2643)]|nr:hypothetical protein V500_01921 [Pseudogymnoascus sp. VKM F-4518 (FW-2643)]